MRSSIPGHRCQMPGGQLPPWRQDARVLVTSRIVSLLPQAESAQESIGVVPGAATRRQLSKFANVASSKHHVLRLQSGDQALYCVSNKTPPLLLTVFFQTSNSQIILETGLLVR